MPQDVTSPPRYSVTLTEEAVTAAKRLLTKYGSTPTRLGLRIRVEVGGCAGLRYALYFDDLPGESLPSTIDRPDPAAAPEGDSVVWHGGVAVLIDAKSGPHIDGSTIDYVETVAQQRFTIKNPKATGGCSCGDSFH